MDHFNEKDNHFETIIINIGTTCLSIHTSHMVFNQITLLII